MFEQQRLFELQESFVVMHTRPSEPNAVLTATQAASRAVSTVTGVSFTG